MPKEADAIAGKALARAREMLQVSQARFAAQLSASTERPIHPTQLSKWERARFRPPYDVLIAAAKLAGVPLDDLMDTATTGEQLPAAQASEVTRPVTRQVADPKQMLLDLLEIGFSLPEAIELVKRARAGEVRRPGMTWKK